VLGRLPIRVRLALTFAVLAAGLVALTMATVFLFEQREAHRHVVADARLAASALSDSDDVRARHGGVQLFLTHRAGSEDLLWVGARTGPPHVNVPAASALGRYASMPRGATRDVTIGHARYVIVAARSRAGAPALAAVPTARAGRELRSLLDAMLTVGALGIGLALLAGWFSARAALGPLTRIAGQASQITAGDLTHRVGSRGVGDEIDDVATAIDAMLDRLEEAFARQRRLVHDASHELRTPITIARGHLEVAALHPEAESSAEAIDLALGELERMGRLVASLLQLARSEEQPVERLRVSLREVAASVIERARTLGERDLRLAAGEDGCDVIGDRDALEQMLLNLVSNAIRHTRPGGLVEVGVARGEGSIRLTVRDDGDGIDPALLPTLFDRFTRTDAARSRDAGGAGLGLAICQAVATAHGGSIDATSSPGAGASFTVLLPAAPPGPHLRSGSARGEPARA
jgi:two-component system OmpR family sensor kinase